jgi:hypothetical protein
VKFGSIIRVFVINSFAERIHSVALSVSFPILVGNNNVKLFKV